MSFFETCQSIIGWFVFWVVCRIVLWRPAQETNNNQQHNNHNITFIFFFLIHLPKIQSICAIEMLLLSMPSTWEWYQILWGNPRKIMILPAIKKVPASNAWSYLLQLSMLWIFTEDFVLFISVMKEKPLRYILPPYEHHHSLFSLCTSIYFALWYMKRTKNKIIML